MFFPNVNLLYLIPTNEKPQFHVVAMINESVRENFQYSSRIRQSRGGRLDPRPFAIDQSLDNGSSWRGVIVRQRKIARRNSRRSQMSHNDCTALPPFLSIDPCDHANVSMHRTGSNRKLREGERKGENQGRGPINLTTMRKLLWPGFRKAKQASQPSPRSLCLQSGCSNALLQAQLGQVAHPSTLCCASSPALCTEKSQRRGVGTVCKVMLSTVMYCAGKASFAGDIAVLLPFLVLCISFMYPTMFSSFNFCLRLRGLSSTFVK